MSNILITGANGMLGNAVSRHFSGNDGFKVFATSKSKANYSENLTFVQGDLTLEKTLRELENFQFDVIVHCAALTDIEYSEKNPEETFLINHSATENLVKTFPDALFIYISTDSVFDGKTGNYNESDPTKPLNIYSKSKLFGEDSVKNFAEKFYILRTNIYGYHQPLTHRSLFEWAFEKLKRGEQIRGFSNVVFNPLYVGQLAIVIEQLILQKPSFGIYNAVCNEFLSKYDFLLRIIELFDFSKEQLLSFDLPERPVIALRPFKTFLDNGKISEAVNRLDLSIDTGMRMLYDDFQKFSETI